MKIQKLTLGFILVFLLIGIGSAQTQSLGTFPQGECVNLIQTCDNCSSVNITSVTYPNSTFSLYGVFEMNRSGILYNYSYCDTNTLGSYTYVTVGDLNGNNVSGSVDFLITKTGEVFEVKQAIIYFITFLGVFLTFLLSLFFNLKIEWRNHRNGEGMLIGVNDLKYLKLLLLPITYSLLVWTLNYLVGLSNLVNSGISSTFFEMMFRILTVLSWPLFVAWLIIYVVIFFRDRKLLKKLKNQLNPMRE